ncbi:MAG: DUF4345 domain-containing protein [Bacteroidota bacterium]
MKAFQIVVLSLSGLALFYACSMRLFNPSGAVFLQSYFKSATNSLTDHIDLVNEIRGVGAVMLLGGIVALIGVLREDMRQIAFVVTSLIFAGVILGRSLSLIIDGMPPQNLLRAAIAEGVLAALNIFCLISSGMRGMHATSLSAQ